MLLETVDRSGNLAGLIPYSQIACINLNRHFEDIIDVQIYTANKERAMIDGYMTKTELEKYKNYYNKQNTKEL